MRRLAVFLSLSSFVSMSAVTPAVWAVCPPAPSSADTPLAIILSGGGAKAAWEAGAASAFFERQLPVRIVAGSSSGALNAAMLADGRLDRLEAVWRNITRDQVYALRPSVFFAGLLPGWLTLLSVSSAASLLDPHPLRELIVTSLDVERVRRSSVQVIVVATSVERRARRVFDNASLTVDVLMAATALPGVFPAVEVDGELLVDGGLTGRAPLLEALEGRVPVSRAIVLASSGPDESGSRPSSIRTTLEEAFETAMLHQIRRDIELARLRHPDVEVVTLTPSAPLPMRPLDFEPGLTSQAFERGRADGLACAKSWESSTR